MGAIFMLMLHDKKKECLKHSHLVLHHNPRISFYMDVLFVLAIINRGWKICSIYRAVP
jgi:hypothetical protein